MINDQTDLVTTIVSMMPPAWENDPTLSDRVRAMFEYFSLYEEKNDGPAAVVFGDGTIIGARLDRLGLRPLRTVETTEYLCAFSEAGQVDFDPDTVIARGRVSAGGMIYYDHREHRVYTTADAYEKLSTARDYPALLRAAKVDLADIAAAHTSAESSSNGIPATAAEHDLTDHQRYRAYNLDQESFRYFIDPMLADGVERVSAMGFGNAINPLTNVEPNVSRFFSQRFAQVTNPPLDSIREADGMSLRVALGRRPDINAEPDPSEGRQIVLGTPILTAGELGLLMAQSESPVQLFDATFERGVDADADRIHLVESIDRLGARIVEFASATGGIAVLSDRGIVPNGRRCR